MTVTPLAVYSLLLWGLGPWAAQSSPRAFWLASALALALVALIFSAMVWRELSASRRRP